MPEYRVAVIGTHGRLPHLLRSLARTPGCESVGVVTETEPDEGLCEVAAARGIDVFTTDSVNGAEAREFLRSREVDLGVCLGWYEVIERETLEIPDEGIVGIHAAPLPRGRGQAPVNWQLILGHDEATVSVFRFVEHVDAGPIYGQRTIPILEGEGVESLYDRLLHFGIDELCAAVERISVDEAAPRTQDDGDATYWPRRRPTDSLVDWRLPAPRLERFVHALSGPYPHAFTFYEGERVEIVDAEARPASGAGTPGEVRAVEQPSDLLVRCGEGTLVIRRANRIDAPTVTGSEFARAYDVNRGEMLGTPEQAPEEFTYTGLRGPGGRKDIELETNVSVGETVRNNAYCFRGEDGEPVEVRATVNGKRVVSGEFESGAGHACLPVEFTPSTPGAHFLTVRFSTGDERRTYVYAR